MIIDKSSSDPIDLKSRLYQIVSDNKISSLTMISDMIGIDEEQTRITLEELIGDGSLRGSFTADGQRFFLSEVKVSSAPVAENQDKGYSIEKADTKLPRMIFAAGFVMLAAGFIIRGLTTISAMMEHLGSGIFMVGLAVLIGGWLLYTRVDPPSNIK